MLNNKIVIGILLVVAVSVMYRVKHQGELKEIPKPIAVAPTAPILVPHEHKPALPKIEVKDPTSYAEALDQSKQLNKDIVVIAGADWCHYCVQLHNTTLKDASIKELLKNYIVYDFNTDKDRSTARQLGISGIPAYFVISKDTGKAVKSGSGYRDVQEFKSWINGPSQHNASISNIDQPD